MIRYAMIKWSYDNDTSICANTVIYSDAMI
jgi:hypothetical protein